MLVNDVFPEKEWALKARVEYIEVNDLLAQSDIISLHVPLFPDTCHILNAQTIARMKRGAYLARVTHQTPR